MTIRIIPALLGEIIGHRTGGNTRFGGQNTPIPFDTWGYSTDWTIGTPHARQRQPGTSQAGEVSQPRLQRQRGGFMTYDNEEMSIYARRSRS